MAGFERDERPRSADGGIAARSAATGDGRSPRHERSRDEQGLALNAGSAVADHVEALPPGQGVTGPNTVPVPGNRGAERATMLRPFTYPGVGASMPGRVAPSGFRSLDREAVIGRGAAVFDAAVVEVMSWGLQRRSGIRVIAEERSMRTGDEALLRIPFWPKGAPCRVVYVVDEPRRAGFAYGTLAGHPERGEEAFLIEHHEDDSVRVRIRAFSRPAGWVVRLGSPLVRLLQAVITHRYLRALAS